MSTSKLEWTDLDQRAVDTVRALAMDAVQKVGNGHPGTAMSLAPAAYLLFQRYLRHDPTDPHWAGRDRFVLSCGHSSLTLYLQLYLSGYGLELDDLKQLRTWGSLTPGHPEHGHTAGVETTTGPLGQGIGNAVGMAMAARRERGLLDPDAPAGESPFDHTIWCFASDGDIEEGITSEASSLAGTQRLGNLVLLYDDNHISIEDDTPIALSEDVVARYEAYGWHVQRVDWLSGTGTYDENVQALAAAYDAARTSTDRPSFIAAAHRHRLARAERAEHRQGARQRPRRRRGRRRPRRSLGFDPEHDLRRRRRGAGPRPPGRRPGPRGARRVGRVVRGVGRGQPERQGAAGPDVDPHACRRAGTEALPEFPADAKGMATRKASGNVLEKIAPVLPELWGGSADLAESNNTTPKGEPSFLPEDRQSKEFPGGPYGRVLHFGIREHAMGSIMNGITLHGGTRVYGGTFLVFSDYMRPAVRLAALMKLPVTYVWTHDSIGLGEDGPTHQPIEHLAALRAIPGLDVVRPADANETVVAWRTILEHTDRPAGLCLSRQDLPIWDRSTYASADGTARGGYVLADASNGQPQLILVATGSEVQLAVAARERLEAEGTPTRVVSMPCVEWFHEQDMSYQQQVLPSGVKARVSVEAAVGMGWRDIVGDAGEIVSIEHYGASAAHTVLFEQFGFTPDNVVAAAHASLERVHIITGSTTGN